MGEIGVRERTPSYFTRLTVHSAARPDGVDVAAVPTVHRAPTASRHRATKPRPELPDHLAKLVRQPSQYLLSERLRHATIKRLRDPTRDRRLRVRVAAERDGEPKRLDSEKSGKSVCLTRSPS